MPTELEMMRLATQIDCEGCIAIGRRTFRKDAPGWSPKHSLHITVGNTDARMAQWIQEVFGGAIHLNNRGRIKYGRKPMFVWLVSDAKAEEILRLVLPYFLIKREQADIALAFREVVSKRKRSSKKLTPVEIEERDTFWRKISVMKQNPVAEVAA